LLVLMPVLPAAAQTSDEIAQSIDFRGYYRDGVADISVTDLEYLVDRFPGIAFVALDVTPDGGADRLADTLLDTSPRPTVIVLTHDEAGGASLTLSDSQLDSAFAVAFDTTGDTYLRDFEEVAMALGDAADRPGPDSGSDSGGAPASGPPWLLIGAVLLVGFVAVRMWQNSRQDGAAGERRFAEARSEITAQMAAMANQILELADRVEVAGTAEVTAHYRRASDVYGAADERLAAATGMQDLERLADDLDDARWELAAAGALLDGDEVPDRPVDTPPEPCFFDPTHGAGVEQAELHTPVGSRTVLVCRDDAEHLRNGDRPEPRTVSVGGRPVPVSQAPRSHGGLGMDALDIFSIIVGGMGDPMPYRWGRSRRRPTIGRIPGGFAGGVSTGPRARGTARVPRGGGSRGRARRGR